MAQPLALDESLIRPEHVRYTALDYRAVRASVQDCIDNFNPAAHRQGNTRAIFMPFGYIPGGNGRASRSYVHWAAQDFRTFGKQRVPFALACMLRAARYNQELEAHLSRDSCHLMVSTVNYGEHRAVLDHRRGAEFNMRNNFGQIRDDGSIIANPAVQVPYFDPFVQVAGIRHMSSATDMKPPGQSIEAYLLKHINQIMERLTEVYHLDDDGSPIGRIIFQVWLVITPTIFPRGVQRADSQEVAAFKRVSGLYVPPVTGQCFWYAAFKAMRSLEIPGRIPKPGKREVEAFYNSAELAYRQVYEGAPQGCLIDVPFDHGTLRALSEIFRCDLTVLDKDLKRLFTTNVSRELYENMAEGHMILMIYSYNGADDDMFYHWCWVYNYTSCVPTFACPIPECGKRFSRAARLRDHMVSKSCLQCKCMPTDFRFESTFEYMWHYNNRETECAAHGDIMKDAYADSGLLDPYQGKRKRDREGDQDNAAMGTRPAQREFLQPARQKQYDTSLRDVMICYDIESIVPHDSGTHTMYTADQHVPYAIGYMESAIPTDYEEGDPELDRMQQVDMSLPEPDGYTALYGLECLVDFVRTALKERSVEIKNRAYRLMRAHLEETFAGESKEELKVQAKYRASLRDWVKRRKGNRGGQCESCGSRIQPMRWFQHFFTGRTSRHNQEKVILTRCGLHQLSLTKVEYMTNPNSFYRGLNCLQQVTLWGHNAGGYDLQFIGNEIMRQFSSYEYKMTVNDSGRIIYLNLLNIFHFRDSAEVLKGSLRGLAKTFEVPVQKTYWPYTVATTEDIYGYVGHGRLGRKCFTTTDPLPGESHKDEAVQTKRYFTEEEFQAWMQNPHISEDGLDVRSGTLEYLKFDVVALFQIMCKASIWFKRQVGLDVRDKLTLSAAAFTAFRNFHLSPNMYPILHPIENEDARKAYQGGNCQVYVHGLTDAQRQAIKEGRATIRDYDATSMYSAGMLKFMPCSHPIHYGRDIDPFIQEMMSNNLHDRVRLVDDDFLENVKNELNNNLKFQDDTKCHIVVCELHPKQGQRYPVAPERWRERTMWTNLWKKRIYLCTPELERALQNGDKIHRIHRYMEFERGHPFNGYIEHFMEMKERATREGNKIMRAIAKLFLNTLYGYIGKANNTNIQVVDNPFTLRKHIEEANMNTYITPLQRALDREGKMREWLKVEQKPATARYNNNRTSNLPMASFITSHARIILDDMIRYVAELPQHFPGIVDAFGMYGDTDSTYVYVEADSPERLQAYTAANGDLTPLSPFLDDYEIGKWKDELREHTLRGNYIEDVLFLASKLYFVKMADGAQKGRVKGVDLSANFDIEDNSVDDEGYAHTFNFENARKLMLGRIRGIKTKNEIWFRRFMSGAGTLKSTRVLSGAYIKRITCNDRLNTHAWDMCDLPQDERNALEAGADIGAIGDLVDALEAMDDNMAEAEALISELQERAVDADPDDLAELIRELRDGAAYAGIQEDGEMREASDPYVPASVRAEWDRRRVRMPTLTDEELDMAFLAMDDEEMTIAAGAGASILDYRDSLLR